MPQIASSRSKFPSPWRRPSSRLRPDDDSCRAAVTRRFKFRLSYRLRRLSSFDARSQSLRRGADLATAARACLRGPTKSRKNSSMVNDSPRRISARPFSIARSFPDLLDLPDHLAREGDGHGTTSRHDSNTSGAYFVLLDFTIAARGRLLVRSYCSWVVPKTTPQRWPILALNQSRLRASLTALLTSSICEAERNPRDPLCLNHRRGLETCFGKSVVLVTQDNPGLSRWLRGTGKNPDDRQVISVGGKHNRGPDFRCSEIGERKSDEDDVTGLDDRRHRGLARSAILGIRIPPAASTGGSSPSSSASFSGVTSTISLTLAIRASS